MKEYQYISRPENRQRNSQQIFFATTNPNLNYSSNQINSNFKQTLLQLQTEQNNQGNKNKQLGQAKFQKQNKVYQPITMQNTNQRIFTQNIISKQKLQPVQGMHMIQVQQRHNGISHKTNIENKIMIQGSLKKPKFGFKRSQQNNQKSIQNSDDLISFDTSSIQASRAKYKKQGSSLNNSKSASNFFQVLKHQQQYSNIRIVENGNLQGYILSKIDKKQDQIKKKLQEIHKNNELYDKKIKQKQWQIQLMKKRMQKQKNQVKAYQSKMIQAYNNVQDNTDSLLISSRNYENISQKMQQRVKNKSKVQCTIQGLPKKIKKQILYGKCMILETQSLQVGFDNKAKPGIFQLYFIIRQDVIQLDIFIQKDNQCGFIIIKGQCQAKIHNITAGKKIKFNYQVDYERDQKKKTGLMYLKMKIKVKQNEMKQQKVLIPFSLYRNFINQQSKKDDRKIVAQNDSYKYVTEWINASDQFIRDPKGYISALYHSITQVDEGVYHANLKFKQNTSMPINILLSNRNFAIQMTNLQSFEAAIITASFLARTKQKQ